MEKRSISIQIMGKEFVIKTDEDEGYIKKVAEYLNGKIDEIASATKTVATQNIVILAALNITDEYFKFKEGDKSIIHQVEERAGKLIELVESSL